jgi:hypothetical protein
MSIRLVDELEQHFSYGNYQFINQVSDPRVVGYYFRCVIKLMEEPLCTFQRYMKFKSISLLVPTEKLEDIIMMIAEVIYSMDPVYIATWRGTLEFFWLLVQYKETNRVLLFY